VAQTPRIGVLGMRDPGAHAGVDLFDIGAAGPPLIAQAAQAVAEAPHAVLRQAAKPVVVEHEAEKLRRLAARRKKRPARVKDQSSAGQTGRVLGQTDVRVMAAPGL
jgi:hypothetical protein